MRSSIIRVVTIPAVVGTVLIVGAAPAGARPVIEEEREPCGISCQVPTTDPWHEDLKDCLALTGCDDLFDNLPDLWPF